MPVKKKTVQRLEQQKMVDFGTAITRFWTKYAEFDGVAQRSEYWFAVLFIFLVEFVFDLLVNAIPFMGILYWVWSFAIIIPCLSVTARRLHDAGFSAKWLLALWGAIILGFVLLVGGKLSLLFVFSAEAAWIIAGGIAIFLFVVSLLPSKKQNNPYC